MKKIIIIALLLLAAPLSVHAMGADRLYAVAVEGYTNQLRVSRHLQKLQKDPCLTKAAIAKAKDVATRGYISHAPAGENWSKFTEPCPWQELSENIAFHFGNPLAAFTGLTESPPHFQAMLVRTYNRIGIGTYEKYPSKWITVMYVAQ